MDLDNNPAAAQELSDDDKLAMALMALATTGVGGLLGGKQGAMAGAVSGGKGAAMVAQDAADKQSEAEKAAAAARGKQEAIIADTEKQKGLIDYRAEVEGKKPKEPELRQVDGTLLKVEGDKATPLYTAPAKPDKPPKDITVQERNTLQSQYDKDPEVKKVKEVLNSYQNIQALKADPTPAADQALIFAYMKALDPGSVVRETEYETAQAIGSLQERAKAKWEQMTGGGQLTQAQRNDIIAQVEKIAQSQGNRIKEIDTQFLDLAKRRGVDAADMRLVKQPEFGGSKDSGLVTVTDGTETLVIPREDLAAAQKDGFKEIDKWANGANGQNQPKQ